MIEVERDDFFVESIKNPIEYGTYYKIKPKIWNRISMDE